MTGNEYKTIIDDFDVENNSKYQKVTNPDGSVTTYCNVFAYDVADECDAPLPHTYCYDMLYNHLYGNNWPNWYSVSFTDAQLRANSGHPTIAITGDHVAIVRPNDDGSTPTSRSQVRITQAGNTLLNNSTLNYGWPPARLNEILFYSWYD